MDAVRQKLCKVRRGDPLEVVQRHIPAAGFLQIFKIGNDMIDQVLHCEVSFRNSGIMSHSKKLFAACQWFVHNFIDIQHVCEGKSVKNPVICICQNRNHRIYASQSVLWVGNWTSRDSIAVYGNAERDRNVRIEK